MKKHLLFFLLVLTGCGAGGPLYSEKPIERDKAQLVIYRPQQIVGSVSVSAGPDVKINGKTACSLPNSAYFVSSVPEGNIEISSTKMLAIGTSRLKMEIQANKRYFVRITWNEEKAMLGLLAEAISQHSGPFIIEQVNEETAKSDMIDLKMSMCE